MNKNIPQPFKATPVDMTPDIREVNGKRVYFYNLQQVEYSRDQSARYTFQSRHRSPITHTHSYHKSEAHKHITYGC